MKYEFQYYKSTDFYEIEQLILASYQWEKPVWGLSRHEFSKGLHPAFTGNVHALEHTVGVYREGDKIVACVINEGDYSGEVFFLFDSQQRATDEELLKDMLYFAKTNASGIKEDGRTACVNLFIPEWNTTLAKLACESKFERQDWGESTYILPFGEEEFEVQLPEGYSFADGTTTPDFYLSNTHRHAFGYGREDHACKHGEEAFHNLRQMKHYRKEYDLCVLDPEKRPVAMAIIWYDEQMPYCELEPLGVAWWERRKGIASALLHEAANRVKRDYPKCQGMKGGDQQFYQKIGYKNQEVIPCYHWELKIYISWEKESYERDYAREM